MNTFKIVLKVRCVLYNWYVRVMVRWFGAMIPDDYPNISSALEDGRKFIIIRPGKNNMTNKDILTKAIKKAVENGYELLWLDTISVLDSINEKEEQHGTLEQFISEETIIFSHDFAKAFWGEEDLEFKGKEYRVPLTSGDRMMVGKGKDKHSVIITFDMVYPRGVKAWVFHLQQMVTSEEPLKYLERFI